MRGIDKLFDYSDSYPSICATGISPALNRFENGLGSITAKAIIDIDDNQGWPLSEAASAP